MAFPPPVPRNSSLDPHQFFLRVQRSQQLCNGLSLPGQDKFGRKFTQPLQDKTPLVRAGMGQHQFFRNARFQAERNQVQIQPARFVDHDLGFAAKFFFQDQQFFQQGLRRFAA